MKILKNKLDYDNMIKYWINLGRYYKDDDLKEPDKYPCVANAKFCECDDVMMSSCTFWFDYLYIYKDNIMTYKDLLIRLQSMTEKELAMDVLVEDASNDTGLDMIGFADQMPNMYSDYDKDHIIVG